MFHHDIISIISADLEYQEKMALKLKEELKSLPEGRLYRKKVSGKMRYYQCISSKKANKKVIYKYISRQQEGLKSALKRKQVIKKCLPILLNNIELEKRFLKKYQQCDLEGIETGLAISYEDIPCGRQYNEDELLSSSWAQMPYEKNESFPEGLKNTTLSGIKVRSKSEVIIAGLLESHGIPFRYESQLVLGAQAYYPDFTILRPKDNKIVYWEHFGMADDRAYSASMYQKIGTYIKHGIIPGTHLIMTFETEGTSIDPRDIAIAIKAYLTG